MTTYGIPLSCPFCGGHVHHVTTGAASTWAACALARCADCGTDVIIRVTLHATDQRQGRKPITNHGSEAGYQAHRRRGETPCADCLGAHNAYTAHRKQVTKRAMAAAVEPQLELGTVGS